MSQEARLGLIGPQSIRIGLLSVTLRRLIELHDGGPIVNGQPMPPEWVAMQRLLAYEAAREVLADNTIVATPTHTLVERAASAAACAYDGPEDNWDQVWLEADENTYRELWRRVARAALGLNEGD